jgi:hypothetical protein
MRIGRLAILSAACCVMALSTISPVMAKRPPCSADEMAIPDDRPGGGKLCLKKSEWEKARKICAKNGTKDPMECICQDADSVGACGD